MESEAHDSSLMKVTYFHRKPMPHGHYSIELIFDNLRRDLDGRVESTVCVAPCYSLGILRRIWIAVHAHRHQGDVNHVTGDINFVALSLDARRTVLTNHDCGFVHRTRGIRRWVLKKFWLDWPVRHVAAVTTVSTQIKKEIVQFTGCDPQKVHVIPNAVSSAFSPLPKSFNAKRPKILHIGTAPNKNLPRIVQAVAGTPCVLAIVGVIDRTSRQLLNDHHIDFENFTNLSDSELLTQYHECDMVVFASLYEGFGLPIIEAQAVGRPVLTSNLEPMIDVAGLGACFIDPTDVQSIRAGLKKILGNERYREELVQAGFANIQRFSRERVAEQYLAVYRSVLAIL